MHYFVVGSQGRDEWNLNGKYEKELKEIIASVVSSNTEIVFLNPHSGSCDFSYEDSRKRQLAIINWGYHTSERASSSDIIGYLGRNSLCNDEPFKVRSSPSEVVFYALDDNRIPLASFDTVKNRLYLLWDAIHYKNTEELNMFKRIFTFLSKQLPDHALFQPGPPAPEMGYNQTITFNKNLMSPNLNKFRREYQEKQALIDDYRARMAKLLIELKGTSQRIIALESAETLPPVTIANKWVRHIQVTNNGFSIFTHPLFITYVDKDLFERFALHNSEYSKYARKLTDIKENLGKKYGWYVGQFNISIDLMNDWQVTFMNLDNARNAFWHDGSRPSCHPHVDGRGKGCLGNLSELIAFAQSNFEIETLIDSLIGYVQSSNIDDPAGYKLYKWDLVNMETMKDVITGEKVRIEPVILNNHTLDIVDGGMPIGD